MGLKIKEQLKANLTAIFKERGITGAEKAEAVLGVAKSTVDRAWNARSMARLDTLEDLAHGLKIQPWQLLVPDMDPLNLPRLSGPVPAQSTAQKVDVSTLGMVDSAELIRVVAAFSNAEPKMRQRILDSCAEAESAINKRVSASNDKP